MGRLDIGWLFVKRCRNVGINCIVRWKVNTVIYLLYIHTVVLPIVLFSYLLKLNHTNIVSFLHLRE